MNLVGRYFLNILKWLDIGANVIFLFGASNETISERSAKARNAGRKWGCLLCGLLDRVNPGHCDNALTSTIGDDAVIPDGK